MQTVMAKANKKSRLVLALSLGALLAFFAATFCWEGDGTLDRKFWPASASSDFTGSAVLSGFSYDRLTRTAAAQLELRLKAGRPNIDINRVAVSFEEDPADHSHTFQYCHLGDPCFTSFEELGPNGTTLSSATIKLDTLKVRPLENVAEVFYPFDKLAFRLDFVGCVNDGPDACAQNDRIAFEDVRVELADADFIVRADNSVSSRGRAAFFLQRKLFIRNVSLVFLLISVIFLSFLPRSSNSAELMTKSLGFFGTLWGLRALLVPSTVKVFPTSIDYVILVEFCFLFLFILVDLRNQPQQSGG